MIPSGLVRVICTIPLSNTTWKYSQRKNSKITSSLRHYRDKLWRIPESPTDPYGIPRCRTPKSPDPYGAFLHDELKSLQNLFFSKGGKREIGASCLHSGLDPRGGRQGPQFQCLLLVCAPSTTMPAALLEAHEILWESLLPTDVFVDASKKETATQFRTLSQFRRRHNSGSNIRCQKPKKIRSWRKTFSPASLQPPLLSLFVLTHSVADSTIPSFIRRQIPCGMSPPSLSPSLSVLTIPGNIPRFPPPSSAEKKPSGMFAFFSVLTHSTTDSTLPSFFSRQIPHEMSPPPLSLSPSLFLCWHILGKIPPFHHSSAGMKIPWGFTLPRMPPLLLFVSLCWHIPWQIPTFHQSSSAGKLNEGNSIMTQQSKFHAVNSMIAQAWKFHEEKKWSIHYFAGKFPWKMSSLLGNTSNSGWENIHHSS